MAGVVLKNLIKRFGKTEVLHGINIEINDSEFIVLVGPSGCGKSTTLRMIAGLEDVSDGEIFIDGKQVNEKAPKDRDVAMVFQNYALYPHMNVFNNMAFGLQLRKIPKQKIKEQVDKAAKILNIEDLMNRKPAELSGGQRQRVAMGRAIVRDPSIFLFDEPLSNLDAKLRTQMRVEIKLLHQRVKATVIYVTHDQIEAMTLGDRIVVMRDGYIEQIGNPVDLFQNPINRFVAGFIGNPPMNLLDANVDKKDSGLVIQFQQGLNIPVPEKKGVQVRRDKKVIMGLRTQDIVPADQNQSVPDEWKKDAYVDVVEPQGSETIIHADLDGVKLVAQCEGRRMIKPGEKIKLALNLNHLHIFDRETEKSIY